MKTRTTLFLVLTLTPFAHSTPAHLIIFIHGTIKPADFSFASLIKIMRNNIANSLYSRTNSYIRNDPFFYYNQTMQDLGLHPIDVENPQKTTAQCMAKLFEEQYKFYKKPEQRFYYTFGWNGLLNVYERYNESQKLYESLEQEVALHKNQGVCPRITIIAFSHGGNVALNLAHSYHAKTSGTTLSIDTLFLLGMPVQKATDHLTHSPLFKKIYHCYSSEDTIQILDIFTPRQFFSSRTFYNRKKFKLPEKLTQIRFRMTYKLKRLQYADPTEPLYKAAAHRKIQKLHKDPRHTELWSFNWAAPWYRDHFPITPLPVCTFIPSILEKIEQELPNQASLTFDYLPTYQGALLHTDPRTGLKAVPVLTKDSMQKLYTLADEYAPLDRTYEQQEEKIALYLKKAQADLKQERMYRNKNKLRLLTSHYVRMRRKFCPNLMPDIQEIVHT